MKAVRACAAAAAVCMAAAACVGGNEITLPSAAAAADDFLAAWSAGDAAAMTSVFSETTRVSAARLERRFERVGAGGAILGVAARRTGPVPQPTPATLDGPPVTVTVPYSVAYTSRAAAAPAVLEGSFELAYDEVGTRWRIAWDEALLWPGIAGAAGFDVRARWPQRAPLLDRRGRRLAAGDARRRTYPRGSVGGSTIGHLEPLRRSDLRDADPLREVGDVAGGSGLEAAFERRLAGRPRTRLVVVDRAGDPLRALGGLRPRRPRPLRTTLDIDVQRAAEAAFGSTVGGAVVIAPDDGDLLAVVSSAPFDPNNYVGVDVDPFNRALSGLYPPGSAMKVVTAAAALDSGKIGASTRLSGPAEYRGVRNFESGAFGTIDFASALRLSVNTAFAQVAERLGARLLTRYARRFGFNREPATALDAARPSFPFPSDDGDLMWGAIGQARVLATPLQMATVAATVANRGIRMEPRSALSEPRRRERVVSARAAATLTRLMVDVVRRGTGTAARLEGVEVAGKTGTAEVDVAGVRRNHAWFVCFAPAGDPKVAIAVVSEYGGVGGQVAAPLARAMLRRVLPLVDRAGRA